MMQCIAIDDEPLALALLEDNISKVPFLNLVAKCSDAFEAMKVLQENKIDLIFIDIQMPGMTGLQFIESLSEKPMVILQTAYKQYALDGYDLNVVDYLVKPVELKRFIAACNKAWDRFQGKPMTPSAGVPGQSVTGAAAPQDFMFVSADYSLVKISFPDISWVEGLKDYLKIHLRSSAKPVISRMTLKEMEDQLPPAGFIRIHKSFIVSVESITSVRKNSVFIGEMELPVGETYKEAITKLTGKQ